MKNFTVDLYDQLSVSDGLRTELLSTKTSRYPIVRYANPTLIYISDSVMPAIDMANWIDNVDIIKTQNQRLLLIPETNKEDALLLVVNNQLKDIFTGEKEIHDCPYQDHLIWLHNCPVCGAACLDRKKIPQVMERVHIPNINQFESPDKYPRYVHVNKKKVENYHTFEEGVEKNGITLFNVDEKKYYHRGSYSGTGLFSAIIKMKPNSSIYFKETKHSSTMYGLVWDGKELSVQNKE